MMQRFFATTTNTLLLVALVSAEAPVDPKDLVSRARAAMGGERAFAAIKGLEIEAAESSDAAPPVNSRVVTRMKVPSAFQSERDGRTLTLDGDTLISAATLSERGRAIALTNLRSSRLRANLLYLLALPAMSDHVSDAGASSFDGVKTHGLTISTDGEILTLWFSDATGLPIVLVHDRPVVTSSGAEAGREKRTTRIREFRVTGGTKFPSLMETRSDREATLTTTKVLSIEINPQPSRHPFFQK